MQEAGKLYNTAGHYICDVEYTLQTTATIQFGTLHWIDRSILRNERELILQLADGTKVPIFITDILGGTFKVTDERRNL